VQKVPKEIYTEAEIKLLLKEPSNKCDLIELRNWAVVTFFFDTGIRTESLCCMKVKDISFDSQKAILTHTKNKQAQIIDISDPVSKALKKWLRTWDHNENSYLFPTQYGNKIDRYGLYQSIKKYNKSRGVNRTGLHRMRHNYATHYIIEGNVFQLQKNLGHKSLEMSKEYLNLSSNGRENDCNKHSLINTVMGVEKKKIKMKQ
jgi:integrase/recombinase XerD